MKVEGSTPGLSISFAVEEDKAWRSTFLGMLCFMFGWVKETENLVSSGGGSCNCDFSSENYIHASADRKFLSRPVRWRLCSPPVSGA